MAQSAGEEYAMAHGHLKNAQNIVRGMKAFNAELNQNAIEEFKAATLDFHYSLNRYSAFRSLCIYNTFLCHLNIAQRYYDAGIDSLSLNFTLKAIDLWPTVVNIKQSDIVNGVDITESGITYPQAPIASRDSFNYVFYEARGLAAELFYIEGKMDKSLNCAVEGAYGAEKVGAYNIAFSCNMLACNIYNSKGSVCTATHCAVLGIKNAANIPAEYNPGGLEKTDLSAMANQVANSLSTKWLKRDELVLASIGLSSLSTKWGNNKNELKLISEAAYDKGGRSFEFLYNMLKYSYERNDAREINRWEGRINKARGFKSGEWETLAALYKKYNKESEYNRATKKAKNAGRLF